MLNLVILKLGICWLDTHKRVFYEQASIRDIGSGSGGIGRSA